MDIGKPLNEGYVSLFLHSFLSEFDPMTALTMFFLFLGRILPVISLSPFFGSRVMPHPVKGAFAICLFAIFLPKLLTVTTTPLQFNLFGLLLLAKEVFVGFCIGFLISIPFTIVQSTGLIIDHQRGGASLMVNDPTVQNQSSPFGTLFNQVLILLFYAADAPFLIIDLLITSYDVIPPDHFLTPIFFDKNNEFWKMQIRMLNQVMVVAIRLATPALLIMLMTDLFLGIANRLAPQVQITFLGMALKSLLGMGIVCIGWYFLVDQMGEGIFYWLNAITEMFVAMKPGVS
jgi:type III secretion protein SpaR/YscT/HrcT